MAKPMAEVGTRIAPDFLLKGKISGDEDMVVAGRLEGSLELAGTLYVEPSGVVKADLRVERAVIAGVVVGNVEASESIQIAPEGRVMGDLHAPRVSIAEGARYAGAVDMGDLGERGVFDEAKTQVPRPAARVRMPPEVVAERRAAPAPVLLSDEAAGRSRPPTPTIIEPSRSTVGLVSSPSTRPQPSENDPRRRKRIVVKKRS